MFLYKSNPDIYLHLTKLFLFLIFSYLDLKLTATRTESKKNQIKGNRFTEPRIGHQVDLNVLSEKLNYHIDAGFCLYDLHLGITYAAYTFGCMTDNDIWLQQVKIIHAVKL